MEDGRVSFVRAVKDYFESEPFGRKVEIEEFKALTKTDKTEIREMLITEGYDVQPFPVISPA